ncbi:hypothetical protein C9374_000663 [Naegleria lovaniensis]|uniref:Uncharacterized protein n=1 Tax=Naegleria lovaniensis TaxID=51637 RepID=A0AA88GYU1_NAELO|nr:uncharacterized protein C9374_000663 [Naegleria lovaniensis]KAG2388499.1 hypothetical protein C9374_000663 [Naegleria lovaniensis]
MSRLLISYQPKNPFYTTLILINKNNYTDQPCVEPYFLSIDPQKIMPNHLDFSNGLFVSEVKEQLYLHSEVPCWFGLTNTGKIAIMIEVDRGADFNASFQEKCRKFNIDLPEAVFQRYDDDEEVVKETPRESTGSPSVMSSCDSEMVKSTSKKSERRKELKFDHLTKMKHDTKLLLVKDFLHSPLTPIEYLQKIAIKTRNLDGFNFIVGDLSKGLYFYSNKDKERCIYELVQGEYAISSIPGLDTSSEVFECVRRAKKEFLKSVSTLSAYDLDEVPVQYDELSKWVKSKQDMVVERRKQMNSSKTLHELFSIIEKEEKLGIEEIHDMSYYLKLHPSLFELLRSMFINHPVFATELNMMILIHDSSIPSEEECIKTFGKKVAHTSGTQKRRKGVLKSSSSVQSIITPTRVISIETPEKPPPPMFSIDRKKYLCNLYIRKYNQDLLTRVRNGEFNEDEYWETLLGGSSSLDDSFYKSIFQYFYIDTTTHEL